MERRQMTMGNSASLAFKLWSDPFVGKRVIPRFTQALFRRLITFTIRHEQARAHFAIDPDRKAKRDDIENLLFRRQCGNRRDQEHHHRRHTLRRRLYDLLEPPNFSRSGISNGDRAETKWYQEKWA